VCWERIRVSRHGFRVSVAESIDRLIRIADNHDAARSRKSVDQCLIGAVEVLVFVCKHVCEGRHVR